MNVEYNRLSTFTNWPASAPVDPPRLARGGFFYTGEGTEVQCFSCNGKITQWNYGDQVMWRHRLMEPSCTFVVHPSLSGNVSLNIFPASPDWTEETGEEGQSESDSAVTRSTSDYGLTEEDEMYRSDALRLLSFINWEDTSVSREALVNAGFYHSGEGHLRCAWCGGELVPNINLGALGSPLEIHRMYFPRCDHAATIMASVQSSNLSLSPTWLPSTPSPTNDNGPQSSGAAHNSRILNAGNTWRALGVVSGGARHPTYSSLATRINSFQYWPSDRTQTPLALAEAGFFHMGTDDQVDEVRCFYCDGGLGKWEPGDAPWTEHARWFPSCGYVVLVKGQEFVDSCEQTPPPASRQRALPAESRVVRSANLPVTEQQINDCLESAVGMGALSAGLDAARVKRAIARRLRTTGVSFATSEALIDAVLDEQLNEEAWSVSSNSQRFARDILGETLQELAPHWRARRSFTPSGAAIEAGSSQTDSTRTPLPLTIRTQPAPSSGCENSRSSSQNRPSQNSSPRRDRSPSQNRIAESMSPNPDRSSNQETPTAQNTPEHSSSQARDIVTQENENEPIVDKTLSLEEENRQLKESRICKVCMDSEVSVVFLPCGHLVSCARCGAALEACPLCRAAVKALVRAYLA